MGSTLAITDIPRFKTIFIQLNSEGHKIRIAGEIHRGVEEIEHSKPDLIIFQNHLSGLSADIVLNHLKGKVGRRSCRYILISPPESLSKDFTDQLAGIIDPNLPEEIIRQHLLQLMAGQPVESLKAPQPSMAQPFIQHQLEKPAAAPETEPQPSTTQISEKKPDPDYDDLPLLTYSLPRRQNTSIVSAFSQHLESTVEELPESSRVSERQETQKTAWHGSSIDITDIEETKPRSSMMLWLSAGVVAIVIVVTYIQHRPSSSKLTVDVEKKPAVSANQQTQAQTTTSQAKPATRIKNLPSFIAKGSPDPAYASQNPGWERHRVSGEEYRIFRDPDGTIKAIQLIDKGGAGISESAYNGMLKEVAGISSMRTASSEIKDGFEIRRGDLAGIQLVQYRDSSGGKIRGFVLTWP